MDSQPFGKSPRGIGATEKGRMLASRGGFRLNPSEGGADFPSSAESPSTVGLLRGVKADWMRVSISWVLAFIPPSIFAPRLDAPGRGTMFPWGPLLMIDSMRVL